MSEQLLGEHEARISAMEEANRQMHADVREIRDFVISIKAKWRVLSGVLVAVGAFFGAVAAFVADVAKELIARRVT